MLVGLIINNSPMPEGKVHLVTLSRQIVSVWHVSILLVGGVLLKGLLNLITERVSGWRSTA